MKRQSVKVVRLSCLLVMLATVAVMVFSACGKDHECAICGEHAYEQVPVENQQVFLCDECHRNYIEIQQLFNEGIYKDYGRSK